MYLIAGLGNPGDKYTKTRHNCGFLAIDELAKTLGVDSFKNDFFALYGNGVYEGEKVILLKPQTFMNDSGKAIRAIMDYKDIPLENLIVIYDDIDIDGGKLRVRAKGSAGSHNGMKSILSHLGSGGFSRVRVGIGKPQHGLVDYVLGTFTKEEMETVAIETAAKAALAIIKEGVENAQSLYN